MTSLNIRMLLKNKVLWAWPIIAVLLALLVGWYAEIQSAGNSYSFLIAVGDSPAIPSAFVIDGLAGFLVLIAIIGLPSHFSKNLESKRASLLLSKPVSRSNFFFSEFASVMAVSVLYTLVTIAILAVLLIAKAGIFPIQLYLAILFYLPLAILAVYVSIVLLLILTESYLASVLVAFLVLSPLSGLLLEAENFLGFLGWDSNLMLGVFDGLSYLVPSTAGVDKLMMAAGNITGGDAGSSAIPEMTGVFVSGFAAFDWSLFGFVLVSCIPFLLLSYYMMRRKEF